MKTFLKCLSLLGISGILLSACSQRMCGPSAEPAQPIPSYKGESYQEEGMRHPHKKHCRKHHHHKPQYSAVMTNPENIAKPTSQPTST